MICTPCVCASFPSHKRKWLDGFKVRRGQRAQEDKTYRKSKFVASPNDRNFNPTMSTSG